MRTSLHFRDMVKTPGHLSRYLQALENIGGFSVSFRIVSSVTVYSTVQTNKKTLNYREATL